MDKKEIEKQAYELLKSVHYDDNEDFIDIIRIAKDMGFSVGNALLNTNDDGFLLIQHGAKEILGIKTDKLIGVNSQRSLAWKRFIIAHEVAHYILHFPKQKTPIFAHRENRKGKNIIENDADFFAACLLMPKEKFRKKYEELKKMNLNEDDIITLLAKKFIVTPIMTERRIKEISTNE